MGFWSAKKAEVPPVCRSGYLLVVFGEVSEKSPGLSRGAEGQKSPSLSTAYFRLHKMYCTLSPLRGTDEDFRYLLTGKPGALLRRLSFVGFFFAGAGRGARGGLGPGTAAPLGSVLRLRPSAHVGL